MASLDVAPLFPYMFEVEITDLEAAIEGLPRPYFDRSDTPLPRRGQLAVLQLVPWQGDATFAQHDIRRLVAEAAIASELFHRLGIALEGIAASALVPELANSDARFRFSHTTAQREIAKLFDLRDPESWRSFFHGSFDIEAVELSSPAKFKGKLVAAVMQVNLAITPPAAVPPIVPVAAEVVANPGAIKAGLEVITKAAPVVGTGAAVFTAGMGYIVYVRPKSEAVDARDREKRANEILESLIRASAPDRCKMIQSILTMTGDFADHIDGHCGPITLEAIKQFETKRGGNPAIYNGKPPTFAVDYAPFLRRLSKARAEAS